MEFIKYLQNTNENTNLSDRTIKKFSKLSGIKYLKNDLINIINTGFIRSCNEIMNKLSKITKHRNGKIIQEKDLKLLLEFNNDSSKLNKIGGNYDGYCDNNIGQCSDAIMCGGNFKDDNIISKKRFENIIKSKTNLKVSKNLIPLIQNIVENKLYTNLVNSRISANKDGRNLVNLGDLLIHL